MQVPAGATILQRQRLLIKHDKHLLGLGAQLAKQHALAYDPPVTKHRQTKDRSTRRAYDRPLNHQRVRNAYKFHNVSMVRHCGTGTASVSGTDDEDLAETDHTTSVSVITPDTRMICRATCALDPSMPTSSSVTST